MRDFSNTGVTAVITAAMEKCYGNTAVTVMTDARSTAVISCVYSLLSVAAGSADSNVRCEGGGYTAIFLTTNNPCGVVTLISSNGSEKPIFYLK